MSEYLNAEEEASGGFLMHLPAIMKQRRWLILIPFVLISLAGLAASFLLPTTYRSSAILVVQNQELPAEFVGSEVGSMIDQRVAKIRQDVMSRGDLIQLIQTHGLYEQERRTNPLSEVVEEMRDDATVEAVSADIGQEQGAANTIAFEVGFTYKDPVKAQLVVQSFVDKFLEQDSALTAQQAESAVAFLSTQAGELNQQLTAVEAELTRLKGQNGAALASGGLAPMSNSGSYDAQIAALQRDNAVAAQQGRVVTKDPNVAAAEAQLAAARAVFAETHPDVQVARQRLQEARRLASANVDNSAAASAAAQIAANNAQIAALMRARAADAARSSSVSAVQARAPVVMERAAQLESRAEALREQMQSVSTRLLSAQNSAKMQAEDKGERLSVADPPVVPDKPSSPTRLILIAASLVAGAAAGIMLALLVELLLKPIRGVNQIESLLGVGPLVVVPTLKKGEGAGRMSWFARLLRPRKSTGQLSREAA